MALTIFYVLFLCYLLTYEPIWGYISYQRFKKDMHHAPENKTRRIAYYKETMLALWIPTLIIVAFTLLSPITFSSLGFSWPSLNTSIFGKWISYILLALFVGYLFAIVYHLIAMKTSQAFRDKVANELEKMPYQELLPESNQEKKLWSYVSLTAGVTEEIIYRGFLLLVLMTLVPDASEWFYVVIAGIIFGLAHTYQGLSGFIRTSLIGIFFSMLYLILGSLFPLMIFHFLIDFVAKVSNSEVQENKA